MNKNNFGEVIVMKENIIDERVEQNNLSPLDKRYYDARESLNKYSPTAYGNWAKGVYGKKYIKANFEDLRSKSIENFSLQRSVGLSITVLAMLLEKDEITGDYKYTFEQIMDPEQLLDEKQRLFDKIITATTSAGDDNRKYLKELFVNGMKRGAEIMDKMVSELDFEDEHYELSEKFHQLTGLSNFMFDAWQEIDRDNFDITPMIQEDNPEAKSYQEVINLIKNKYVGPYSLWNSKCKELVAQHINVLEGKRVNHNNYLIAGFSIHAMKNDMDDWRMKGNGMPPSEYFGKNKTHTITSDVSQDFSLTYVTEWAGYMDYYSDQEKEFDELISTGKLFKNSNVQVTSKKGEYDIKFYNMPTFEADDENKKIKINIPLPDKKTIGKKKAKLPVSFDSYILLHTTEGGLEAETLEEKNTAISKVLAAYTLKKLNRKFSIKEIHKVAEHISKTYGINEMMQAENIDDILKNKKSVMEFGEERRRSLYDIEPEKYDSFVDEMKTLSENMISSKGHSDEYKALFDAVKEASELNVKTADMSPEKKAKEFRNISIKVVHAVDAYTTGKEKIRWTTKGEDCFNNAMDALSVVSRNTARQKGYEIHPRASEIISRIQNVRGESQTIQKNNFENQFGGNRAQTRMNEKKNLNNKAAAPSNKK